jgi:hypothetical protein
LAMKCSRLRSLGASPSLKLLNAVMGNVSPWLGE